MLLENSYRGNNIQPVTYVLTNINSFHAYYITQSCCMPGQDLSVPGGRGSQILRQSAHEGGKVVSPTHRPPLSPGNIPGTHLC
jgi:hypothetical protein